MGRVVKPKQPGCCSEKKLRKGLWSPEEDERLASHIARFGVSCWSSIPDLAGLQRCGKSCRLRWMNYLRPDLKRGRFSQKEEDLIMALHETLGNSWSQIAARLPGRSDNEIKNFWNARLRKKLRQKDTAADETRRHGAGVVDDNDRKPAAVFDPFPHHSAPGHQPCPAGAGHNGGWSISAANFCANAVVRQEAAGDEARTSEALLADGGERNEAAESVTAPCTSASVGTEAAWDVHGDDDDASHLLGEYYLDDCHDGFAFWGGKNYLNDTEFVCQFPCEYGMWDHLSH